MDSNNSNNTALTVNPANQTPTRVSYAKISNEKRQSLIRLVCEQGQSILEASEIVQINYNSARVIVNKYNKHNIVNLKAKGGSIRTVLTAHNINKIEEIVTFNPQFTLKEIKEKLEQAADPKISISISSINRCLEELKITMKLSHRELDRVNSAEKIILRKEYALWFNNHFNNDFSGVIFIDESSFNLHLKRSHARSKQGTRAIVSTPTVRGRSISLIASMTINGMGYCKTIANSTVNANIFTEYITELCCYWRDVLHMQKACLIMDNARIHKKKKLKE